MKQLMLFVLISIILTACKKDDGPEIISPGPYFPVYPGSWWKYMVNDSIECIDSTGSSYVLSQYEINDDYHDKHYVVQDYLPWYYSSEYSPIDYTGPVFKYDMLIVGDTWYGTLLWPILSEEIGFTFNKVPRHQYPYIIDKMTVEEKRLEGNDSVLIVVGRPFINEDLIPGLGIRYMKYVKNIGLVLDYRYEASTNDTINKRVLVDFYISNDLQ